MMKKWLTLLAMTAGLVSTGNAADINRLKTFTGTASQWPWALNADGTFILKRPAFPDLSSALADSQNPASMATPESFGALGNGSQPTAIVSITSGSAVLTAYNANFNCSSLNALAGASNPAYIEVPGAGSAGGVLYSTISSCSNAYTVTLANNASTTVSSVSEKITFGSDDTTAVQNALNTCKIVFLGSSKTYLVNGLTFGSCPTDKYNPSSGIASVGTATLRLIKKVTNNYVIASSNYANNVTYADYPTYCGNITFDAGGVATYAVVGMSFAPQYVNCHFTGATSHGIYESGRTKNGSQILNPRVNATFVNSDAFNNGGDGLHVDDPSVATYSPTDMQIKGGYWHDNAGYGLNIAQAAGLQMQGVHAYSNYGGSYNDLFLANLGFGSVVQGNYFEGNVIVDYVNGTSHSGIFGPGNQVGGYLKYNGGSFSGEYLRSVANTFYNYSNSGIYQNYNGPGHFIVSSGDVFQGPAFTWNNIGSPGTIVAENVTVLYSGTNTQGGPCTINGVVNPHPAGFTMGCTDFDVAKTASAAATTITFTITATVANYSLAGGAGFNLQGTLDVSSYSAGPTLEVYSALVQADYSHVYNTTTVAHSSAVKNATSSGGGVSAAISCVDTTVSSSTDNVETCTVTVTVPAASNGNDTRARLRIHSNNRLVKSMSVN